jgi:type I restriction enzyme M protein
MVFKNKIENPENILFLDASQYYEKATNQNILRENDMIDKIIYTYRNP